MLNSKTFGQGPPLVVLHGLFGTLDNWQTLGKQWAKDFTVVLLDLRNHGRSPHYDQIDYPTMAADVREYMEANWLHRSHVLGHSMGGKVAMELALHYGDMVDKLVVVDIAPRQYPGGHETILEAMLALDVAHLSDRTTADAQLQERIPAFGVRNFLLKNLSRQPTGGYAWKMNLPVIHAHYADILDNVSTPFYPFAGEALFIRGHRSDYVQDSDWPAVQERFPQADLVTIADAGHWVHADQPKQLYTAVRDFLLR